MEVKIEIEEIKKILKKRKISYEKLSEISGISLNTIRPIMCGITKNPRIDTLKAIERALGIEKSVLTIKNIEDIPKLEYLPVIGEIACGTPILAEENIKEYMTIDNRIHADFLLIAKGDSMINARIFDGDIVYIKQQPDVENGEIAAVLIEDRATLKRVYKYPGKIVLRSENPTYNDIVITDKDNEDIRIIGKVVMVSIIIR